MTAQLSGSRLPRPLRPFRHREYRLLATSMAASLFASGLWLVAGVYQVIALGGGPSELSIVATATAVGLLVSALGGGVAADRLPKRALLLGVEGVRVVSAATAGALAVTGALQLWHLAVISFVLGAAEAFFFPAYSAILPTLLPADELLAANGVEGTLRPVAQQALGPALAGVLVGAFAPSAALLLAAAIYAIAAVTLVAMRRVAVPAAGERSSVLGDLAEGFRYLFRTGWLFATLAFATLYVLVLIGPIEVLLPFAVRDQTGGGASSFALVLGAFGVGGAIGSLVVSSWRLPRRYLTAMILLWGAGAAPLALIGVTTHLWVMAAATFVVGFTGAAAMVIWGTLLQRRVPPHLLGRVSSLDFFVSLALMPVSMAVAGPVGEQLGVPMTFVLAGLVPVFLAVAAILGWRLPADEIAHPLDGPLDATDDPAPVSAA
ncbi:putative MFS family arabinose efflux permease [Pseudonocardia hierapolitana]|uniref:Putative MFS family arabinose efflux permease n=1 Tax=Pseudonocardia hierapolitana TaxID=1128676 RepID=A0A561SU31_9PSEU|nr:MFS transporter [Pseudonocardia hierapolitana]TWF78351.1 putative MFS family arabinose efflux permease [Pseudonocardia hierapolitana]